MSRSFSNNKREEDSVKDRDVKTMEEIKESIKIIKKFEGVGAKESSEEKILSNGK